MVHETKRNLRPSKLKIIFAGIMLSGCATYDANYSQYLELTNRLASSQNAAEAACLLVIAEGIKNGDPSTKVLLSSQIEKCKRDPIKVNPPRNWLGFY